MKALLIVLGLMGTASAQTPQLKPEDAPANYGLCLDTARAYPQQGLEVAQRWDDLGGGEPAKHCIGVALIGLRRYAEAAKTLEGAAITSKQSAEIRAGLLAQAGQAWSLSGDPTHAEEAQTAAIKLLPQGSKAAAPILIDRAMILAETKQYQQAIVDLTAALVALPGNADALAFRAAAYREISQLDLAQRDADAAVAADASNLDALLERGNVYRMKENLSAARADWEKVIALAPDSAAANVAHAQLDRLGTKPEKKADKSPGKKPGKKS